MMMMRVSYAKTAALRRPSGFGLVSVVGARGLAGPPKKNKLSKKADEEPKDDDYHFYCKILDSPALKRPKFPPEVAAEHYRIGREYNRRMRLRHDKLGATLQLKLDLQQFALKTLPPDLYEHANSFDGITGPPIDRRWWSWTPPIPGFDPSKYADPPITL